VDVFCGSRGFQQRRVLLTTKRWLSSGRTSMVQWWRCITVVEWIVLELSSGSGE